MTIVCQYWERIRDRGAAKCILGWHGGRVHVKNCLDCLAAKENTPEAYQKAQEAYERRNPDEFRGQSNCCGSALNY